MSSQNFSCFLVPVWGEEYVNFFLDYCLPSQLSKNNIPGLKRKTKYVIITSRADIYRIIYSPSYKLLKSFVDEVVILEVVVRGGVHELMSECYRNGMKKFRGMDMPFIFLTPDSIVADGTFVNMEKIINSGKRAIYLPGIRLIKEEGIKLLAPYFTKTKDTLEISSAELMTAGLQIIHEWGYASFLEEGGAAWLPSNIYWRVGKEGILAHCFHLHPLMVWPRKRRVSFLGTIDDDLVEKSSLKAGDVYVVRDSKELLVCEFSKKDRPCKTAIVKNYMPHLMEWMDQQTRKAHRELFKIPIYMHCGKMTPALWSEAEEIASYYVKEVEEKFPIWCRENYLTRIKVFIYSKTVLRYGIILLLLFYRGIMFFLRKIKNAQ